MLKRLFSIFSISLIITGSFFSVYNIKYPVYADSTTDGWTQVTTNQQLVDAFKAYCKSRDVTIEGSIADGVTTFTSKTFDGIVNTLGIDVNVLQANLKYKTDGNLGFKFLFNAFSIDAYNRIFAQFLQDNDLEVGDENVNKLVYSGELFTDADGYSCFVWDMPVLENNNNLNIAPNKYGSTYKYDGYDINNIYDKSASPNRFTFNLTSSQSHNIDIYYYASHTDTNFNEVIKDAYTTYFQAQFNVNYVFNEYINDKLIYGQFIIYRVNAGNDLYFGKYTDFSNLQRYPIKNWNRYATITNESDQLEDTDIYIISNTINNNVYEGDTIINNNGTPDDDDDPDIPDPNPGPTPDPPTIPDSGGWQDFSLPEMPNDWLIYGMEKKFPFDIPFNILFALSLLNHEPEIPKFEGDIDLQVCTWHYDIDLTPFDDIATILRKFEVLGFIIGLAILTKNLINWG